MAPAPARNWLACLATAARTLQSRQSPLADHPAQLQASSGASLGSRPSGLDREAFHRARARYQPR